MKLQLRAGNGVQEEFLSEVFRKPKCVWNNQLCKFVHCMNLSGERLRAVSLLRPASWLSIAQTVEAFGVDYSNDSTEKGKTEILFMCESEPGQRMCSKFWSSSLVWICVPSTRTAGVYEYVRFRFTRIKACINCGIQGFWVFLEWKFFAYLIHEWMQNKVSSINVKSNAFSLRVSSKWSPLRFTVFERPRFPGCPCSFWVECVGSHGQSNTANYKTLGQGMGSCLPASTRCIDTTDL